MGLRRRLGRGHKSLAVQVSKDAWAQANGDREVFENLVREDSRTVGIDPALVLLFIRLAMAIFDYFKNRSTSVSGPVADESESDVVLGSIRYLKG